MKIATLFLSVILGLSFVASPAYSDAVSEAAKDMKDPAVQKQFQKDMQKLLKAIKKDKKYDRIPLDTEADGEWFTSNTFAYWDHKMSKSEFVDLGEQKFPGHEYEFNFVADRLSR